MEIGHPYDTHVVSALRRRGVSLPSDGLPEAPAAFAADVEDVLRARVPTDPPLHAVYLDHCGSAIQR